jgi:hypothetical protein
MRRSKRLKTVQVFNPQIMFYLQSFLTSKEFQIFGQCSRAMDELVLPLVTSCLTWTFFDVIRPARLAYIYKMKTNVSFNQDQEYPPGLKHLTFGEHFNRPILFLPRSLTHLTFGRFFNHSLDNLPHTLTHLTCGNRFNQPIDDLCQRLPNLRTVIVGADFNQKMTYREKLAIYRSIYKGVFDPYEYIK